MIRSHPQPWNPGHCGAEHDNRDQAQSETDEWSARPTGAAGHEQCGGSRRRVMRTRPLEECHRQTDRQRNGKQAGGGDTSRGELRGCSTEVEGCQHRDRKADGAAMPDDRVANSRLLAAGVDEEDIERRAERASEQRFAV